MIILHIDILMVPVEIAIDIMIFYRKNNLHTIDRNMPTQIDLVSYSVIYLFNKEMTYLYIQWIHNVLLENVFHGEGCILDEECESTQHSKVCKDWKCVCNEGYVSIHGYCLKDK
jgi:hypothetical protein